MFERTVNDIEYDGLLSSTIPVFDEYGEYNEQGLAIVSKDGKVGVVNNKPEIVVPVDFERIKILKNGVSVAYDKGLYYLFDKDGLTIVNKVFASEEDAESYGRFF